MGFGLAPRGLRIGGAPHPSIRFGRNVSGTAARLIG